MSDLLENINRIHTTTFGAERISRNLDLAISDVVEWCKNAVEIALSPDEPQANKVSGKFKHVYKDFD